jgi:hypothetical protein
VIRRQERNLSLSTGQRGRCRERERNRQIKTGVDSQEEKQTRKKNRGQRSSLIEPADQFEPVTLQAKASRKLKFANNLI